MHKHNTVVTPYNVTRGSKCYKVANSVQDIFLSVPKASWDKKWGGGIGICTQPVQSQAAEETSLLEASGITPGFLSWGATILPSRFLTFEQSSPITNNYDEDL